MPVGSTLRPGIGPGPLVGPPESPQVESSVGAVAMGRSKLSPSRAATAGAVDDRELAWRFQPFAVPTRLRVLILPVDGERYVGDLAAALGCSQANPSHHLTSLRRAGGVEGRRDGL